MNGSNFLIDLLLKLKHAKFQFVFLFSYWLFSLIYFAIEEPYVNLWNLFLLSITVRSPIHTTDFANFHAIVLPILLEVIVFGFIMGELLQKYNPVVSCRILATHQRNHTVIVGYNHISERIVEYCIEHKKKFAVLEDDEELLEDLISAGYPVVVGDPTEETNLNFVGIKNAKEVFICVDQVRSTLICCEKIRKLNNECAIYAQVFENHVREYLKQEHLKVYSFSTSKWTVSNINTWCECQEGKVVVIGRDHLTQRIAHQISMKPNRDVYLFNDKEEGIVFKENDQLHIINAFIRYLSDLRKHINLDEVCQVYICWKEDTEFDESLYLTSKLHLRYPHIQVFVRIFDEELVDLVKNYNATTFSSSGNAFRRLQSEVKPTSAIAIKKKN